MLLLDERNEDIVRFYNTRFSNKCRNLVLDKFTEIVSNPIILVKEEFPCFIKDEVEYSMDLDNIDSPLVIRNVIGHSKVYKFGPMAPRVRTEEISYNAPFTLSFLYKNIPYGWSKDVDEKIALYLSKANEIEFDSLELLYRNVKDHELFARVCENLYSDEELYNDFLTTYYPDIKAFTEIFPYLVFEEERGYNFSIQKHKNDSEYVEASIKQAIKNTEILKQLKLVPKYKR